ncbi:ABC transporter permease [Halostagnicola bangensis]
MSRRFGAALRAVANLRHVPTRTSAVLGIAFAQIRRSPRRTVLAVLAVALVVLSVTLLASLGVGVVDVGEDGLESANRGIWLSGDPVDPSASGTENPIVGAHDVTAELDERDDVSSASPIAMYEIYIGTDPGDLERTSGVGVSGTHSGFDFQRGGGYETDAEDAQEAMTSGEPTTEEVVLDPDTAERLGASLGDTVYLGTSRESAPEYEFTVVGTSSYYSQYLGSESTAVPLPDLLAVAGTTGTDRATFITADAADGHDRQTVAADLDDTYPEYDVRASDEQIGAMLEERPLILASGVTLVGLAIVGGIILTVNLFALVASQQREELAALRAIGLSRWVLSGTIGAQGLIIGLLGGVVGLVSTPVLAAGLNRIVAETVGFERLLRTPLEVYAVGFALAAVVGTIVALVAGWRAGRYARIAYLEA